MTGNFRDDPIYRGCELFQFLAAGTFQHKARTVEKLHQALKVAAELGGINVKPQAVAQFFSLHRGNVDSVCFIRFLGQERLGHRPHRRDANLTAFRSLER